MKTDDFAAAVSLLIEDKGAVHRASVKDLSVLQAVLACILKEVTAELERRDWASQSKARTKWMRVRLRISSLFDK
jgi:hypothetical protein